MALPENFPEDIHEMVLFPGDFRLRLFTHSHPENVRSEGATEPPFWAQLWPAAIGLAEMLRQENKLKNKSVLEIGCGLGLVSLVAAKLGAEVTATDYLQAPLDFVQFNAAANGLRLRSEILDWNQPPSNPRAEVVLAADVLYDRDQHGVILNCIQELLLPGGVAVLSDPCRPAADGFSELASAGGWQVAEKVIAADEKHLVFFPGMRRLPDTRVFVLRGKGAG